MSVKTKTTCDICGTQVYSTSEFGAKVSMNSCEYDLHTYKVSYDWDICRSCKPWFIEFMEEIQSSPSKANALSSLIKKMVGKQ